MKFKKRPVVIEAIQLEFTTTSQQECINFTGGKAKKGFAGSVIIPTLEGNMTANTGDWIIKGVNGEFYPCKPLIFAKTYEPVEKIDKLEVKKMTEDEAKEFIEKWNKECQKINNYDIYNGR